MISYLNDNLEELSKSLFKGKKVLKVEIKTLIKPSTSSDIKKIPLPKFLEEKLNEHNFVVKYLKHDPTNILRKSNIRSIELDKAIVHPDLLFDANEDQWRTYDKNNMQWTRITKTVAKQLHREFVATVYIESPYFIENMGALKKQLLLSECYYFVNDPQAFEDETNSLSFFFKDGYAQMIGEKMYFRYYDEKIDFQMNTWALPYRLRDVEKTIPNKNSLWLTFLNDICSGDTDLISYLQLALGYILLTKEQRGDAQIAFEIVGPPSAGKSVFCDYLFDIIWNPLTYRPPADLFSSKGNVMNMAFSDLTQRRITFIPNPILNNDSDVELIKNLIVKRRLSGRQLYKGIKERDLNTTIVFCTNYPILSKFSHVKGLKRRIRSIPFTNVITGSKVNNHLLEQLSEPSVVSEALNWCFNGISLCAENPELINTKYTFQEQVNELIRPESAVKEFLDIYVTYDQTNKKIRFPSTLLSHLFKFFYPDDVKGRKLKSELQENLESFVKTKRASNGRPYLSCVWVKRAYLWTYLDRLLTEAKYDFYSISTKKSISTDHYKFNSRLDQELAFFILTIFDKEGLMSLDNSEFESAIAEKDLEGPYVAPIVKSKGSSIHKKVYPQSETTLES
uniref:SF3 helicase domain-containing protein n=1 Tax=Erythrotrichia carnea TaxID=35151 RepID=A0A1C9CE58_9RHOD|nr:hypothetical protein Eryt_012 [Erythrotrichia carnea]AOM66678.1 hypothetical protein Eryt_012 [Erythrotrichia carnea]